MKIINFVGLSTSIIVQKNIFSFKIRHLRLNVFIENVCICVYKIKVKPVKKSLEN